MPSHPTGVAGRGSAPRGLPPRPACPSDFVLQCTLGRSPQQGRGAASSSPQPFQEARTPDAARSDRQAQGVISEEERAASAAIERGRWRAENRLFVVDLPHGKTAAVADRLAAGEREPENLLIISPGEVNFFGRGELVRALDRKYPDGWLGGALPQRGFWGRGGKPPATIEEFLEAELCG
jgi:hypothetical protein